MVRGRGTANLRARQLRPVPPSTRTVGQPLPLSEPWRPPRPLFLPITRGVAQTPRLNAVADSPPGNPPAGLALAQLIRGLPPQFALRRAQPDDRHIPSRFPHRVCTHTPPFSTHTYLHPPYAPLRHPHTSSSMCAHTHTHTRTHLHLHTHTFRHPHPPSYPPCLHTVVHAQTPPPQS